MAGSWWSRSALAFAAALVGSGVPAHAAEPAFACRATSVHVENLSLRLFDLESNPCSEASEGLDHLDYAAGDTSISIVTPTVKTGATADSASAMSEVAGVQVLSGGHVIHFNRLVTQVGAVCSAGQLALSGEATIAEVYVDGTAVRHDRDMSIEGVGMLRVGGVFVSPNLVVARGPKLVTNSGLVVQFGETEVDVSC